MCVYACYVWNGYTTALAYTHTHAGRAAHAGGVRCCAAALGALSRGVVVGVAGQREVVRALLEADDAVGNVPTGPSRRVPRDQSEIPRSKVLGAPHRHARRRAT